MDFGQVSAFFAIIVGAAAFFDTVGTVRGNSKLARFLLTGPSTLADATKSAVKKTDGIFRMIFGTGGWVSRLFRVALLSTVTFVIFYAYAMYSMNEIDPQGAKQLSVFSDEGPRWEWFLVFFLINVCADFASFHQTRMVYQTLADAADVHPVGPIRLGLFVFTDVFMSFVLTILVLATFFGLGSYLFYQVTDRSENTLYAHRAAVPIDNLPIWHLSYDENAEIRDDLVFYTKAATIDEVSLNSIAKTDQELWEDVAFFVILDSAEQDEIAALTEELYHPGVLCGVPDVKLQANTETVAKVRFRLCGDVQNSLTHHLRWSLGKLIVASGTSIQSGLEIYVNFAPLRRYLTVPEAPSIAFWHSGVPGTSNWTVALEERLRYLRFQETGHFSEQPVGTFILTAFCTTLISIFVIIVFFLSAYVSYVRRFLNTMNAGYLDVSKASFTVAALIAYVSSLMIFWLI